MARSNKRGWFHRFLLLAAAVAVLVGAVLSHRSPEAPHMTLYFFQGEAIKAVNRPLETAPEPAQVIKALLDGPSPKDFQDGYTSLIPRGVKLLSFSVDHHVASINLSGELASYGGGAGRVQGMLAQIVYTATELPKIRQVRFLVNGSAEVVLGGEGLVVDKPMSRTDFKL